ncbi:MAG TPA: ABC transporter ATP-binding protein [Patescibacteria group bacterium]|nr:ABC transporter ATP-binding protein [Patescibacteria group bacterium]
MNRISRFIAYYRPYKLLFFADMLCALAVSGVDLIFPILVRNLLDQGINNPQGLVFDLIIKVAIIMIAMRILEYFCQYFITAWGHIMGARMEFDMRKDIFSHLQRLSFNYFDNTKTGQIMSRIVNDLFDISELAHHGPEEVFISVIKIVGAFIILMMVDVKLTLIIFTFIPFMMIFAYYYNKKMRSVFKRNRQKIADVNAQLEDSIAGIRVVKSFSNEELEKQKFGIGNKEFLDTKTESYYYMGKFFSGIRLFDGIIYIAVAIIGSLFIKSGSIESVDLVTYLLYINTLLMPIRKLIDFTEQFQRGMTGFERFLEIMDTEPDILDKENSVELHDVKGMVTFDNVSFKYDEGVHVLNNIDLKLNPGETVALVGPSGGGKSTLCSLIPRFYEVTEGSIHIDNVDVRDIKLESLRKNIGIVQQDVYLFAGTIMENIRYGKPDASDEEVVEAARKANAHEFIEAFEKTYETYVGERGVKLSGGQKQRISIARAFLRNPPILILDEATSALDNQSERIVQQSLEQLASNRTTFIIAHRLSTIRKAKNILVLTDNGIEEKGSHEELLKNNGIYASLYNAQFEGI